MKISSVKAIEILDSRGKPTVRTFVTLEDGSVHSASVPSGASTGSHEAIELRDGDPKRYMGLGVKKAVNNVNDSIANAVKGLKVESPKEIDQKMIEMDGTENKSKLGANALLSVSMAVSRAAAHATKKPLWKFLSEYYFNDGNRGTRPEFISHFTAFRGTGPPARCGVPRSLAWGDEVGSGPLSSGHPRFPRLMVNIVNGGKHASWNFDIQEFMILPTSTKPSESVRIASEIFHSLGALLKEKNLSTLVGDEGGYSPSLQSNEEVFETIIEAAKKIGYENGHEYNLAIDAAATEFYHDGIYEFKKTNKKLLGKELIEYYLSLKEKYNLISFEDPFAEDDWENFRLFTEKISRHSGEERSDDSRITLVVGDDLFVTNTKRIEKGIQQKAANSVLIKLNQIGTVSKTADAINITKKAGWKTIISHRSGETEDPFIADLAYGSGADFIKTGSMSRSERLAKYNRLLEIENQL